MSIHRSEVAVNRVLESSEISSATIRELLALNVHAPYRFLESPAGNPRICGEPGSEQLVLNLNYGTERQIIRIPINSLSRDTVQQLGILFKRTFSNAVKIPQLDESTIGSIQKSTSVEQLMHSLPMLSKISAILPPHSERDNLRILTSQVATLIYIGKFSEATKLFSELTAKLESYQQKAREVNVDEQKFIYSTYAEIVRTLLFASTIAKNYKLFERTQTLNYKALAALEESDCEVSRIYRNKLDETEIFGYALRSNWLDTADKYFSELPLEIAAQALKESIVAPETIQDIDYITSRIESSAEYIEIQRTKYAVTGDDLYNDLYSDLLAAIASTQIRFGNIEEALHITQKMPESEEWATCLGECVAALYIRGDIQDACSHLKAFAKRFEDDESENQEEVIAFTKGLLELNPSHRCNLIDLIKPMRQFCKEDPEVLLKFDLLVLPARQALNSKTLTLAIDSFAKQLRNSYNLLPHDTLDGRVNGFTRLVYELIELTKGFKDNEAFQERLISTICTEFFSLLNTMVGDYSNKVLTITDKLSKLGILTEAIAEDAQRLIRRADKRMSLTIQSALSYSRSSNIKISQQLFRLTFNILDSESVESENVEGSISTLIPHGVTPALWLGEQFSRCAGLTLESGLLPLTDEFFEQFIQHFEKLDTEERQRCACAPLVSSILEIVSNTACITNK